MINIHKKDPLIIPIVYITDNNFVMQTAVSITSLIYNRKKTNYKVYIISSNLSTKNANILKRLSNKNISVEIIEGNLQKIQNLHVTNEDCKKHISATEAALFKFQLPNIFHQYSKILYLDGDTIITNSLEELYNTNIDDYYVAAAHDTGKLYFKHEFVELCPDYFNSGVMLLNLDLLRKDSITEKLIKTKLEQKDSFLMDQNALNVVFKNKIKIIDIKYNLLIQNLERSYGHWNNEQINKLFNSNYKNFDEIKRKAYIIHFSSKDKPWFFSNITFAKLWYKYYKKSPFGKIPLKREKYADWNSKYNKIENINPEELLQKNNIIYLKEKLQPDVSVIIPVYNAEKYIETCLISLIKQTYKNIEIICVDGCSTDDSWKILEEYQNKDSRIKIFRLAKNLKQGAARNKGIEFAKGKYITFVDSDDFLALDFIEKTYNIAQKTNCDIVFANVKNFFLENSKENIQQSQKITKYYTTLNLETGLYNFCFNQAPSLRKGPVAKLYRKDIIDKHNIRFPENLIQEDEAFYWFYMFRTKNLYYLKEDLYYRLIHSESVMYNLNFKHKNCLDHLKIIKIIYQFLKDNKRLLRYKNKFKDYACTIIKQQPNFILKFIYFLNINSYINISFEILGKTLRQELFILQCFKKYKTKKIAFWGASMFIRNFFNKYKVKNKNIIGIIDKDSTKQGDKYSSYTIYSPDEIENLNPDIIIISIINFSYERQKEIKNYIKTHYKKRIKIIGI